MTGSVVERRPCVADPVTRHQHLHSQLSDDVRRSYAIAAGDSFVAPVRTQGGGARASGDAIVEPCSRVNPRRIIAVPDLPCHPPASPRCVRWRSARRAQMDILDELLELFVVASVAALAPLISVLIPKVSVPQVVILIVGGIAIGPVGLGVGDSDALQLIANVGLGFVFLLAGFEIEPASADGSTWSARAPRLGDLGGRGLCHRRDARGRGVRPRLRACGTRADHHRPGHRAADLAGAPDVRGDVRADVHGRRRHRRALPHPCHRDLPRRQQPSVGLDLDRRHRSDRRGPGGLPSCAPRGASGEHRQQWG